MNPTIFLIFTGIFGACVGSFLNVVIYRLPAGLSLVHPPSRCPKCEKKLAWYDNVPVFGWLWLRGKCRWCSQPISIQYPIVEATTGLLFAGLFYMYFQIDTQTLQAQWYWPEAHKLWPVFLVHLFLIGGLIAATGIDAKYYIIPLSISWAIAGVALVGLTAASYAYEASYLVSTAAFNEAFGVAIGGVVGLVPAILLLRYGVIPQSFADEQEVMEKLLAEAKKEGKAEGQSQDNAPAEGKDAPRKRGSVRLQWCILLVVVGVVLAMAFDGVGMILAGALLFWGILLPNLKLEEGEAQAEGPEVWLQYPYARREMFKELAFVVFPLIGAILGAMFAGALVVESAIPTSFARAAATIGGVMLGYIVGGGLIWSIRIFGTLAFGKEAMGLGDAHLLAAIGAVLGPVDALLVFFMAPFFGLGYTVLSMGLAAVTKRQAAAIPYGPHLCGAAVVLMLFHEWIYSMLNLSANLPGFGILYGPAGY